MSCHNYCSGSDSLGSLRNLCHIPLTSSISLCSTNVSSGDVLCLPSSHQDHTWLLDNCQETCSEPTSCQPANCEPSNLETSHCPSTAYYVSGPCQGTTFLPAASYVSSSYLPASCRPPRYVSSSCRPLRLLPYGCRPLGCLPCGPQPLSVVSSCLRPLHPLSIGYRPLTHVFSTCHPSCSPLGGQYPPCSSL
ncbi:keratin-associated protein 26-1 [Diceros bicornis minor]|uniref:keratin-associated protein 26-1 n=1 Tax=Diceros bicornis minor TaxID=77932 RepID=UPI0026E9B75B|nr:keratin-associated protein 26-1 [Diceros bicornis minor]